MKINSSQENPLILVADDSKIMRILLRQMLKKEGYIVKEAEDGEACLQLYQQYCPDLVILDVMMPKINGFDCCRRIKQLPRGDRTPILMITALNDQESVTKAFDVGAVDYITKPIHHHVLLRRLRRILEASWTEQALRERSKQYSSVVNNLNEIIFQTDTTGHLIFLNPAWTKMTGFTVEESLGKSLWEFIHPNDRQKHWHNFKPLLKTIASNLIGKNRASFEFSSQHLGKKLPIKSASASQILSLLKLHYSLIKIYSQIDDNNYILRKQHRYQVRYLKKNKDFGWMEVYAYIVSLNEDFDRILTGISGTITDITEKKAREKYIKLENAITQILAESNYLKKANQIILQTICQNLDWDLGEIWLFDEQRKTLECQSIWFEPSFVADRNNSTIEEFADLTQSMFFSTGEGIIGRCWQENEPILLDKIHNHKSFVRAQLAEKLGLKIAFLIPISSGDKNLGIFAFYARKNDYPELDFLKVVKVLSSQIGQFIRRKQAEAEVQLQNQILQSELNKAAEYVSGLLPYPQVEKISIDQQFIPSIQLGGDAFDYYWLDAQHFAFYLFDVAGHGVQAALLSVSILNILRSQSIPGTDLYQPSLVLKGLNQIFQMNDKGENYFTIWYGIYNLETKELVYACAGHPPAILITEHEEDLKIEKLESLSIPIGMMPDYEFEDEHYQVPPNTSLYIFSDGIYEIDLTDGNIWCLDSLIDCLADAHKSKTVNLETLIQKARYVNGSHQFSDDVSILQLKF